MTNHLLDETLAPEATPSPSAKKGPPPRRSFHPRFGLRGLLVFAILFCLFFGWIGRGYLRARQEDAAIETILRTGGSLYTEADGGVGGPPGALSEPSALPLVERGGDLLLRSVGWRKRPAISTVELRSEEAGDPAADEATAALAVLREVRIVSLTGPAFNDASLRSLDRLPRLEALHLVRTLATPEGLTKIAAPERIEHLYVEGHVYLGLVASAGVLRSLRKVDLVEVVITQGDVAALASLPELEELRLSDISVVGDGVLTPLASAGKLRILEVTSRPRQEPCDADDLRAIASLPNLERLRLDVGEVHLPLFVGEEKLRFLGPDAPVSEETGSALPFPRPGRFIRIRRPNDSPLYVRNGELVERPAFDPAY